MKIFRCSVLCFVKLMQLKWKEREHLPRRGSHPSIHVSTSGGPWGGRRGDPWTPHGSSNNCECLFYTVLVFVFHPRLTLVFRVLLPPSEASGPLALLLKNQVLIRQRSVRSAEEIPPSQKHELHLIPDGWQWTSGSCGGLHRSGLAKFKWMRLIGAAWFTALDQSEWSPEPEWTSYALAASQLKPFYFQRSF